MGGLIDAFRILIGIAIAPISNFALKAKLLSTFFRQRDSDKFRKRELDHLNKKPLNLRQKREIIQSNFLHRFFKDGESLL